MTEKIWYTDKNDRKIDICLPFNIQKGMIQMDLFDNALFQVLVVHTLIPCFCTTELIECTAALIYPKRNRHDLILVFLVNVATNPAAVFLNFMLPFRFWHPVLWVIFLEGVIWLVEASIYRCCLYQKRNPFLFSFVLNAASYGIGWLI